MLVNKARTWTKVGTLAQYGVAKKTLFGHFVPSVKREMRRMQFMRDIRELGALVVSIFQMASESNETQNIQISNVGQLRLVTLR